MLTPDDRRLEKWEKKETGKTAAVITRQYTEAAKDAARLMKELFRRLREYDKPPAAMHMDALSLKQWRVAKRQEQMRNSKEVRQTAARLAAVAAFAAPLVNALCREVWQKNAWINAEYKPEPWAKGFFADYSRPEAYDDTLRNGFSLLLDGVHAIREYAARLADLIGRAARKVINVLHGAAKRAQNWARMQWIRMANAYGRTEWGKQWVTQDDDRVRKSHDPMNGQRRRWDESFQTAAGNYLMYPGDTSAPIEEWINCRCNLRRVRIA